MPKRLIYADNAATTPLSTAAFEAMKPFLSIEFYNPSTKYSASRRVRTAVDEARVTIASCIGANPDEIYFTSGGTESDNWAVKGTMFGARDGQRVITDQIEHQAILNSCKFVEKIGYPVDYLTPYATGEIIPESLESSITSTTKLVTIMLANNELGTIQPVAALSTIAHAHGALFHTDAVQAVAHIPIDVNALGVDMLSASAHKFGGPKGCGFLYVRKEIKIESLLSGGSQEHAHRGGTENVAGIVGMAAALKERCDSMHGDTQHLLSLRTTFTQLLDESGLDYHINGGNNVLPSTISLSIKDMSGEMLLHRLDLMGIQVATGSACDSKDTQLSHVLKAIQLDDAYAFGTIRLSFSHANNVQDICDIVNSIKIIEQSCKRP